ncbi:MAG TPA: metallopeptidase TldD-related protein, partial [Pseudomonadales bacterium]|nr:metallopeptidase TldD-related protein [Pseudomonadales bacterium]
AGDYAEDSDVIAAVIKQLRLALAEVTADPYLLISQTVSHSEHVQPSQLPETAEMVADIVRLGANADLVGLLASGDVCHGFANGFGQRNWHQTSSWNFDWSLYSHADKAVKRAGAGLHWNAEELKQDIDAARTQLALLTKPAKTLTPGYYRAYLTPTAVAEILSMLNWGALSEKAFRTKQSALEKLATGEQTLSPLFCLSENVAAGLAPGFQAAGFIRPDQIELICAGKLAGSLISPRTAKEYGLASNGAGSSESADSFEMAAGDLALANVLKALDTGLFISNLWYLNYSDRTNCAITGMTRFACFWVEKGQIVAPLNVMRFDDSLYRLLGSQLEAVTREREFLADAGTYGGRSCASQRVPGALVSALNLVL